MLKKSIKNADMGWKNASEKSYNQITMKILSLTFLHVFEVLLPVTAFRDLKNR